MGPETVSCPYCNTEVVLTDPPSAGARLRCPRCHESFPNRAARWNPDRLPQGAASGDPVIPPATLLLDESPGSPAPSRRSNRSIVAPLLSIMAGMALVGLVFALLTQQQRRLRDFLPLPGDSPAPVVALPPAKLAALGYLPRDVDVVLGFHVAEGLQHELGRELLERLSLGSSDMGLRALERWTGLELGELDHVVLGLKTDERLLPRVTLVVHTRAPYLPERVLAALRAGRRAERNGKTVYRFPLERPPIDAALWLADQYALVIGLTPEDLDDVPLTPVAELERLPPELHRFLTERLSAGTQAWAIGHAERWEKTAGQLLLAALKKDWRQALLGVQTFGLQARLGQELALRGTFHCVDLPASQALEQQFTQQFSDPELLGKLLDSRSRGGLLNAELARSLKCSRAQTSVEVQATASTEALRRALQPPR
jgi:hypothetical protein